VHLFFDDFGWGLPIEAFTWPVVECEGDGFEVLTGPTGEVGSLGGVLAQPVRVLVRGSLPGRVRVCEEHSRAGIESELGVPGEFLTAIPGEGFAQLLRVTRRGITASIGCRLSKWGCGADKPLYDRGQSLIHAACVDDSVADKAWLAEKTLSRLTDGLAENPEFSCRCFRGWGSRG
jgi:hypothetical protein